MRKEETNGVPEDTLRLGRTPRIHRQAREAMRPKPGDGFERRAIIVRSYFA